MRKWLTVVAVPLALCGLGVFLAFLCGTMCFARRLALVTRGSPIGVTYLSHKENL